MLLEITPLAHIGVNKDTLDAGGALPSWNQHRNVAFHYGAPFFSRPALNESSGSENQNLLCCILNAVFCI